MRRKSFDFLLFSFIADVAFTVIICFTNIVKVGVNVKQKEMLHSLIALLSEIKGISTCSYQEEVELS